MAVIDLNKKAKSKSLVPRKRISHEEQVERTKDKADQLSKELKKLDFKNEGTVTKNLNKLANNLNKMLDVAYKHYIFKPGFGNSNSFVQLTNALQNVMANLRQLRTPQEQAQDIMNIITRHHAQCVMQFQNMFIPLREGLPAHKKADLNKAVMTYGEYLTASTEQVRKDVEAYLAQ